MERINQSDLTARVADKLELPMTTAKSVVDNFVDELQEALLNGNKVNLSGFVSLGVRSRRSRMGRNPKTGEAVKVPTGRKLFMKTSPKFKDGLNKKKATAKRAVKAPAKKKAVAKKAVKAPAKKKAVAKKAVAKKAVAKKAVKRVAKKAVAKKAVKRVAKKAVAKRTAKKSK